MLADLRNFPRSKQECVGFGSSFLFFCFTPNLCGRLHRLHGNFTLPPFAPDARLKYHYALYGSSQNRVAIPIFASGGSRSPEIQGHGAPLRKLAAQGMCTGFGYSIVKVPQLVLASFFQLVMFGFQATKKAAYKRQHKTREAYSSRWFPNNTARRRCFPDSFESHCAEPYVNGFDDSKQNALFELCE